MSSLILCYNQTQRAPSRLWTLDHDLEEVRYLELLVGEYVVRDDQFDAADVTLSAHISLRM